MSAPRAPIDWEAVAEAIGALSERGESSSTELAKAALVHLVGPDDLADAVDWYVDWRRGHETVREVLRLLRPDSARRRCLDVWRRGENEQRRMLAVELFRVMACERDLPLVKDFLADRNEGVQSWGISLLDLLMVYGEVDPADVQPYLAIAHSHANVQVRQHAARIADDIAAGRYGR
jgi:hypothetical protein